jgi:hypothetical protein
MRFRLFSPRTPDKKIGVSAVKNYFGRGKITSDEKVGRDGQSDL